MGCHIAVGEKNPTIQEKTKKKIKTSELTKKNSKKHGGSKFFCRYNIIYIHTHTYTYIKSVHKMSR